jgi:predicted Zn-dependent peptidase
MASADAPVGPAFSGPHPYPPPDDAPSPLLAQLAGSDGPIVGGDAAARKPWVSRSDDRSYRYLTLPNKLRVMLVSDPAADKAAAAMAVHVGHLSDPRELPGLSHFLEHMLFLGNAKYEDEAAYKLFLKHHGGGSNASTSAVATTYHFFVHHASLEEALDRFGQFFVSPLFTPSATDRELHAVDAENAKNLQDDGRRDLQMRKALADPAHVYSKFGTGNLATLRTQPAAAGMGDVRPALLAHYGAYYSANLMTLSVLGRGSLDELESWVRGRGSLGTDFGAVANRDAPLPHSELRAHPYPSHRLARQAWLAPVRDVRTLVLTWPVPDQPPTDYAHALTYLSHLLGHEGEGSLCALLKSRGWITGLSAGASGTRYFANFSLSCSLTPAGLAHTDDIVALAYQYVALMQAQPRSAWEAVFAEVAAVAAARVRFKAKVTPVSAVTNLVSALHSYPAMDAVVGGDLYAQCDPEAARAALALFHPRNMLLVTTAQSYAEADAVAEAAGQRGLQAAQHVEPYYGFQYATAPLSEAQIAAWGGGSANSPSAGWREAPGPAWEAAAAAATLNGWTMLPVAPASIDPGLHLPAPNAFIPTDFTLRPVEPGWPLVGHRAEEAAAEPNGGAGTAPGSGPAGAASAVERGAGSDAARVQAGALRALAEVGGREGPSASGADVDALTAPSGGDAAPAPALTNRELDAPTYVYGPHPLEAPLDDSTLLGNAAAPAGAAAAGGAASLSSKGPLRFKAQFPAPHFLSLLHAQEGAGATPAAAARGRLPSFQRRGSFAIDETAAPAAALQLLAGVPAAVRLWHRQDTTFRLPKTFFAVRLYLGPAKRQLYSVRRRILSRLFASVRAPPLTQCMRRRTL